MAEKYSITGALAILLAAALCLMAQAAELKDFTSYEAPAFVNADGSERIVHEYEDKIIWHEVYGKMTTCVPVADLTATEMFNKHLHIPDAMVQFYNGTDGMIHIVERPFIWDDVINRSQIDGLCYPVARNGRTVWDIDVYIKTGQHMALDSQARNAASTFTHELGHILKLETQNRWTIDDRATYNQIIKENPELVKELESAPDGLNVFVEEEVFAITFEQTYSDNPDLRYKAFFDRIISYAVENK